MAATLRPCRHGLADGELRFAGGAGVIDLDGAVKNSLDADNHVGDAAVVLEQLLCGRAMFGGQDGVKGIAVLG